ncbi:proline-rich protein 5-like [Hetaerina americana]|uniref:proline-rich protein 5-like n=1 Tax=Hetaerina americana TaxID=62018 RepID=UPI003A7F136A
MPLHFRPSPKGEGTLVAVETQRKLPVLLKRTPTFATLLRKEVLGLRSFDPMFRYSLTRLPEEEGADGGQKEDDGGVPRGSEGQCGAQWANIRSAVDRVVRYCHRGNKQAASPLAEGELSALHADVRVLLRTEAGAFIFEYLKDKLLPVAASEVLAEIKRKSTGMPKGTEPERRAADGAVEGELDARKLSAELSTTWEHFYSHSLTLLEAIFYQVKSRNLGIRQAGLIMFRDYIVLPLKPELEVLLDGYKPVGETYKAAKNEVPPVIKQMLLILQGVNEICPPSSERLKLENLVARAITPYLGFKGLYEGGNPEPSKPSQELEVIHKRRPSVVDPRRLNRPLCIVGVGHAETLSELFTLSADRIRHKRTLHRNNTHYDL